MIFEKIVLIITGIMVLGVVAYSYYRSKELKNKGTQVRVTVKSCTKVETIKKTRNREDTPTSDIYYETVFSFRYNGEDKEEIVNMGQRLKKGSIHEAIYLDDGKLGNLAVKIQGKELKKGGPIIGIAIGIFCIFIGIMLGKDNFNQYLIMALITLLSIIVIQLLRNKVGRKYTTKKGPIIAVETTTIDPELIRYIPEKTEYTSKNFSTKSILCILFTITMGTVFMYASVMQNEIKDSIMMLFVGAFVFFIGIFVYQNERKKNTMNHKHIIKKGEKEC